MVASHAAALRRVLELNTVPLLDFARHFAAEHAIPADLSLGQIEEALAQCHALGVVLQVRRLLLEGMGSAKRQLLPQGVLSFVAGLGEQQLS